MKLIFIIATLTVSALFTSNSFAREYKDAGCGLGTMVVGKDGNQVLAATTNGTSYSQTFGISSGTSNCTDSGMVKGSKRIPMFIEVNKLALQKEAARGEGEAIAGLANIMGCNSKSLGSAMKANYAPIFEETKMDAAQIQSKIEGMLASNRSKTCGS
ncbi:MAG: DUF3015 family protein [Pseudobdellovibrionaceae bacterium]|jgi:hypothetical protein